MDSATKGLLPKSTIDTIQNYYRKSRYTVRKSLHSISRENEKIYYSSKERFAEYVNSSPDNLAWTPNADIALTQMMYSLLDHIEATPRVFSSVFEHHSLLVPLLDLHEKEKIELKLLTSSEEVCIIETIEQEIEPNDIIAFAHTTQVIGLYRDIQELANLTDDSFFLTDLSRTAGQTQIDVEDLDIAIVDGSIDLLGPNDSGFIHISDPLVEILDNPFPSSGNVGEVSIKNVDQLTGVEKFELGSPDIAAMYGLQQSIEFLNEIGDKRYTLKNEITSYLLDKLEQIDDVKIVDPYRDHSCGDKYRSSIVTIDLGYHSHDIALFLDETYNIKVRSGLLCSHPGVLEIESEEIIQISTHVYTTKEDIDQLVHALNKVMKIFSV